MRVRELTLEYFRNYPHGHAVFHPGMNIICGDNAQGKTNLLEAIEYLATAHSPRCQTERELILFGVDDAFLTGEVDARGRQFTMEMQLSNRRRRSIHVNGVRVQKQSELADYLNVVTFRPEDLYLIRAGAEDRRRFLDETITQLRPRYADALSRYQEARSQKAAILRRLDECPSLLETLDDFSVQMCRYGAQVIHYRAHYIRRLNEIVPPIHREFSQGREVLELEYLTEKYDISDTLRPSKELYQSLLESMETHRESELASRRCLVGPHRDDLAVRINGQNARYLASQGQTRTAALSLKIAQRDIIYEEREEYPVLLLDDVLSELDPRRQEFVLNRIQGGQVFLTCCEEERLAELVDGKIFRVTDGQITEE